MKSTLYIVSTPIGNYDDITLRALKVLRDVDFIICEEFKPARRLLSEYSIEKELFSINEHNEKEEAPQIVEKLLSGNCAALISDGGTPLFSDPGHYLVQMCIASGIKIIPIPGANSLLPALVCSGLDTEKFYYYGWLSPKKELRRKELLKLKSQNELLVFLETPYRLKSLLADFVKIYGYDKQCVLAYKLTMADEEIFRGKVGEILKICEKRNLKGEFVFLLDNRGK
ncbi:MAG: 16S rRNA (cytidine(1402)-2'-O)-methyltransferase [Bacteroidota bacterium]